MKPRDIALFFLISCTPALAQTYKCKTPGGATEISDQPCRGTSTTSRVMEKEYVSESQRRSSTEWLQRGAARLHQKEQMEAAQEREEQRLDGIRQAAAREEQHRQQESQERQRIADRMARLEMESAAAKEAAIRAEAAANAAAGSKKGRGGVMNCKSNGGGWSTCY